MNLLGKDTGTGGRYSLNNMTSFSAEKTARYSPSNNDYVSDFYTLLRKWRFRTLTTSSTKEILNHREFHEIVAMGYKILPFIIEEIRTQPDHLLAALPLITGEDPVPSSLRGNMLEMANSWIAWYERRR